MGKIESAKAYVGQDLENIFFRPMLTGPDANELGINIMYNMPVPTTLQFWRRSGDILQKYVTGGWAGSGSTERFQKTLDLKRVKAEVGYGADEYYNLVFGKLTNSASVNMGDLSGTDLEAAETALFKESIAESIRATMWVGNTKRTTGSYNTFDGLLARIYGDVATDSGMYSANLLASLTVANIESQFKDVLANAKAPLRDLKSQGNLAFFVTTDIYNLYEEALDAKSPDGAYIAMQEGHKTLSYRGIPVIDVQISDYLKDCPDLVSKFILLTDRRNLTLAVNTADFPGTEVRMWYNPDAMENRQRAVFMAAADYMLPELISIGYVKPTAPITA